MSIITTPKNPTHALHIIDNWDGEGDSYWVFAFKHEGVLYSHENGKPILEYEGDKILTEINLNPFENLDLSFLSEGTRQYLASVKNGTKEYLTIRETLEKAIRDKISETNQKR
ncbi:hypothetical protein QX249_11795 [Vibrio parahaemolyticus]|uniref:Uncharacterized protein n=1 Tax=Vibrio parahaemolyticus TaxID=670 RepID=A0AAW8PZA4_VIBPH|nr:hypothetical protein [Vibrio parahaemolyticus]EGR2227301.1 hypothetical protein [Vibrio parahaemolyticus]MDS1821349.1 hypothetical protein [Vibrio parahaemolyticus]